MQIKPYIIASNLIEQPTWGGKYIAKYKNLPYQKITQINIGQSYELFSGSNLSLKSETINSPSVELSSSQQPEKTQKLIKNDQLISIKKLISQDAEKTLGKKYLKRFGKKITTLIKFTQAKGNSYQIHVKKKVKYWLPKPESWYFFEPGIITLGVKNNINWNVYKQTCQKINQLAELLSYQVKSCQISLKMAKNQLHKFIRNNNPEQFVNLIKVSKNQSIDLSSCGIHHSWEENHQIIPNGNIVYEVQQNVYDSISTIRSFDKGKIKTDGSIRLLQIDDYFKYIDRSQVANKPQTHISKTKLINQGHNFSVKQVFLTTNYSMQEINFKHQYQDKTEESFHHLFIKKGQIQLAANGIRLNVSKGHSIFIPANTGNYQLSSLSKSLILKTYF